MCKGFILSVKIDDEININCRLVTTPNNEYKMAIQGYGNYSVECFYYLIQRNNCEVFIHKEIPESDFDMVIKFLIEEYDKNRG